MVKPGLTASAVAAAMNSSNHDQCHLVDQYGRHSRFTRGGVITDASKRVSFVHEAGPTSFTSSRHEVASVAFTEWAIDQPILKPTGTNSSPVSTDELTKTSGPN